ncbi:cytosolic phospholipase A2-like isoform X2 [Xenia sp. Carnegie-2017]|uniref:cytosolic phospholipase A2-like isoform X2 n=1 Tax=Xenia sp. Carnegie-2017 TaxID=2897299 RepID=UPI001F050207|nr:cytosolic phospholipase A2-like isoform X2 [Xenia sp. Carnegie-2017]
METARSRRVKVEHEVVKLLNVTIVRATCVETCFDKIKCFRHSLCPGGCFWSQKISMSPDPYVTLRVRTSPNGKQQTSVKQGNSNPEWNEMFNFYLNPEKENILELTLVDDEFCSPEELDTRTILLDKLPVDVVTRQQLKFGERTLLDVVLHVVNNERVDLRIGYDSCENEKEFLTKRREVVLKKMAAMFDDEKRPGSIDEVPVIAIMGSGGGYRAACGLSGAFSALQEAGILDCATYVSGLSGSSWYIATLYENEKWPELPACDEVAVFLRERFRTSILTHFHSQFGHRVKQKEEKGQPVSFTDIFGMAIGDALLTDPESKLSHQVYKVCDGQSPLPIMTGIRVQSSTPADVCSEWMEFTPYEFGFPLLSVFGKISEFGSKFYKGRLVRKFEEYPLNYFLGIWGSAFTILLNRVVDVENETDNWCELMRRELECLLKIESKDDDVPSDDDELPEDQINIGRNWFAEMLSPSNLFVNRRGKAAETFNVCRGLQIKPENEEDYLKNFGKGKMMCVVDSGIAFNSPFPPILRSDRGVELILSFDFSQKEGDDDPPFVQLLKAESWARDKGLPFPKIQGNPLTEDRNLRECYVFEDPDNVNCPTILHFPLVNRKFKDFLTPGEPRLTKEDKDFANFDIFNDPNDTYSSFTFQYNSKTFNRLHELMKFNTRLNIDLIKDKVTGYIDRRKNDPIYVAR